MYFQILCMTQFLKNGLILFLKAPTERDTVYFAIELNHMPEKPSYCLVNIRRSQTQAQKEGSDLDFFKEC